jgi:hypothetical protein
MSTKAAALFSIGAGPAVAFTSCMAGAALVALFAARHGREERNDWTAGGVLTAGAMLVFFGHVENYSWVSAAVVAFLLFASRAASGMVDPAWAGALGGLAITFHPIALFCVVPAVLALMVLSRSLWHAWILGLSLIAFPAALFAVCTAAGIEPPAMGWNRFADDPAVFLSMTTALSPGNLATVANRLVLLLSPGILMALLIAAANLRAPAREDWPVLAASIGGLIQLIFLHGKIRPEVQDWDLYAASAFPIAMLAGRALLGPEWSVTRSWCTGCSAAVLLLGVLGNLRG